MSLIIPANSAAASGGYEVDNSVRLFSNTYLHKTPGNAGNTTKFTASFWVKRSKITARQEMVAKWSSGTNNATIRFSDDDTLDFVDYQSNAVVLGKITTRKFRDVGAWYHIVCSIDTTQSVAANRAKIFVNGVQETLFSTDTIYSQNDEISWNNTWSVNVGWSGNDGYMDGYMAEVVFIDGLQLAADQFGEFDEDSGIWKPIDVSGLTFGTNGFYLDFEDSANLGNDANGGTDLTEVNLAATDQSTDTCTNNFATFNPLASGSFPVFSEGNINVRANSDAEYGNVFSTLSTSSSGKWYYEIKVISKTGTSPWLGLVVDDAPKAGIATNGGANSAGGTSFSAPSFAFQSNGVVSQGGSAGSTYTSFATGDIISFSIDMDNGACYIAKNGTYMNSGNPASGSSKTGAIVTWTASSISGFLPSFSVYGAASSTGNWSEISMNFGSPAFAISSGNTDGNGYGNFEYAVPSGYYSLNTKNLAEYG